MEMTTPVVIHFGGGARPNPDPAAIGYNVEIDDSSEGWRSSRRRAIRLLRREVTPS
jgi:hypothetical protein